ncbi:MAG: hypothetical protein ABIV63_10035 [Caldimonas sp.]
MTQQSSLGETTNEFADKAAQSADAAIQSARQKTNDALDGISNTMQSVKDQATATFEKFKPQLESVASYAKDEPTKALLIAAAAGAGIMALVALSGRSGTRRVPAPETVRRSAYSAYDNAQSAARDAADQAASKAQGAMKSTRDAAQSAYENISDTMQQWKDQAGPIVDRIRPQVDTVMGYAKDDPGKALLIAAAAGAALMGLMSSLSR